MKVYARNCFALLCVGAFMFFSVSPNVLASSFREKQVGNTISGFIFGAQRQPVANIDVELTDDFSRTVARVQTNSSGRYIFSRLSSGKYRVRVLPYTTNYQEQVQEVEIVNILRQGNSGEIIRSAIDNSQCDFYLKLKKGFNSPTINGVIFVQEIPKEAKTKYDAGVANIELKKNQEGLNDIKAAIEIFPVYFDALFLLGNEYIKSKHFVAAQVILTKAAEVNPQSYRSWYGVAYSAYSLNQTKESFFAVDRALVISPESVDSIMLKGILLKQEKKYDESLKQLKKAKDLAKGAIPEINWQLALLYANNLNLYNKAAEELELFLSYQPDSKDSEMIKKLIATFKEKAQKTVSQP